MKKNYKFHIITLILVISIICAAVISFAGCKKKLMSGSNLKPLGISTFPKKSLKQYIFLKLLVGSMKAADTLYSLFLNIPRNS